MRCLVVAVALSVTAPSARATGWEADPASGRIVVHVFKKGLFSGFAHDHHFDVTEWRASADVADGTPASTSVEVVLSAGSLRDRQQRLSEADRRKVDAQAAGPEVLDAAHHPRIEFRSQGVELEPGPAEKGEHVRGKLHGTLTLRGRSVPAVVVFEADRASDAWRVHGDARVKQSDFGIKPFSGFAGTVGVKDELDVEITLTLRPAARGAAEPSARGSR